MTRGITLETDKEEGNRTSFGQVKKGKDQKLGQEIRQERKKTKSRRKRRRKKEFFDQGKRRVVEKID